MYKEVEFGRPGPLIVEKIRKGSCSILVIGGQGRGYMAEVFQGRVFFSLRRSGVSSFRATF